MMKCPNCGKGNFGPKVGEDGQEVDGHDRCPDCGYEEVNKEFPGFAPRPPLTQPMESGRNPKRKKRTCIACDAVPKSGSSMTDQGWQAVEMRITQGKEHFRFYGRACPLHHKELFDALEKFEKKHPSAALRRGHIR